MTPVLLLALVSCFGMVDPAEGQSTWLGSLTVGRSMYELRVDWGLIVGDQVEAVVWVRSQESGGFYASGRTLKARGIGPVKGREQSATAAIPFLDGTEVPFEITANRNDLNEDYWPMTVTFRGEPQEVTFSRPLLDRLILPEDPLQGGTLPGDGPTVGTPTGVAGGMVTGTPTTDTGTGLPTGTPGGSTSGTGAARFAAGVHLYGLSPHTTAAPFTMDAWVASDAAPELDNVAFVAWGNGSCSGVSFGALNQVLTVSDYSSFMGFNPITDGGWHHVAVSWNGSEYATYVDGTQEWASMTGCYTGDAYAPMWIGSGRFGFFAFDGRVDEVRIWDFAADENTVGDMMVNFAVGTEYGLIGLWSLDDIADGIAENGAPTGSAYDLVAEGGAVLPALADH